LIELLVVISVIALLIGLLLPALGAARGTARSAVCLSNQRQMAVALTGYALEHDGRLLLYRVDDASGRRWWFGYEAGFASGTGRPIDPAGSLLADHLGGDIHDALQCPDFPDDDPAFAAKFVEGSAHYGYSGAIVWPFPVAAVPRRLDEFASPSGSFAFADAIHTDSASSFYEPHSVGYRRPGKRTGTGHFRHADRANLAYLDGHAGGIEPPATEPQWERYGDAAAVNLDTGDGPGTVYGFRTWTY
jgi:prepilin-type processing-associated H-X9-DG protein